MSSNEITFWLRQALTQNGFDPKEVDNLSSHSCKTTILSWAAKRGLDKSVRKVLGYHVQPDDVSPLTYGRDNLSAPLYQAIAMMNEITKGTSSPDSSRSARFPKGVRVSASATASSLSSVATETSTSTEPCDDLLTVPLVVPESSVLPPVPALKSVNAEGLDSGSHSSVSDEAAEDPPSTDDSEAENELVTECVSSRFDVKSAAGDLSAIPWRHLATKRYHLPKADELGKLGCGRMISYQYEQVTVVPLFLFPRCEVCFGNALHTYVTPSSSSGQN
jgi:hypothetical protein